MAIVISSVLAAAPSAQARPVTQVERAIILDWMRGNLANPHDLRSARISNLTIVPGANGRPVTVVCVDFRRKSSVGDSSGLYRMAFAPATAGLAYSNTSSNVVAATCYLPQIVMRAFPELNLLK
ncbi:hypothetical protein [Methylobacterium durans]|uniref:hypothetical protein n=1 Tax=Methylobacterium durans TaxID=2202825 RepID=UPI0013A53445|nr:hypothetical protein [Methylobacterium durans]